MNTARSSGTLLDTTVRIVPQTDAFVHRVADRYHFSFILIMSHVLVKYKPLNVPRPLQSEVDELAYRVLCIIELCKDILLKAKRMEAEQAGRDPNKEIVSANAMLSMLPMLRQAFPATASAGLSNRGADVQSTSGDPLNPLKRDHDSMINGTAVSLVPPGSLIALLPSRFDSFFVLSLPLRLTFLSLRALT
jgi:hypothetical protein